MQFRQRLDLAGEDLAAIFRRLARQRRIPEHPALFHRHDVEGRADHAVVGAQRIGFRDRKALLAECGDDAEFAVDRMRRRQQFAERPAPHHIGSPGGVEPVGRIGLAALELQDGQRSLIALDVLAHPAVEAAPHRPDAAPRRAWCPKTLRRFLTPSATMTLPHFLAGAPIRKLPLVRSGSVCILPKFKSGNGAVMDLVRTVGEPHRAHRGIVPGQTRHRRRRRRRRRPGWRCR